MIRVRDNPGLWWLLAILFVSVGGGFVYFGIAHAIEIEWWQAPLALIMGATAVGVGIWWAWRSPLSTVAVNPAQQDVRLVQYGLFGRRIQTVPFARIEDVIVERQSDSEGAAVVRPALLLRDGTRVPLSALWQHNVKGVTRSVAARACAPARSRAWSRSHREEKQRLEEKAVPSSPPGSYYASLYLSSGSSG